MSAFLCSPLHIGTICTWAEAHGVIPNRERAATILAKANIESIEWRYEFTAGGHAPEKFLTGGADDPEVLTDAWYILACQEEAPGAAERPAVDIWSLCRSLAYQSCEHRGYDGSPADVLCQKIATAAAAVLGVSPDVATFDVPGAEDAPWSI